MPFAVGQVQDVGLIFLSAMASSVVDDCVDAGLDPGDTLATTLATLSLSTAVVGLLIVLTGVLKLASIAQYCPLPVVGGYLAFVGAFMAISGAGLSSGLPLTVNPATWPALFAPDPLLKLLPAGIMVVLLSTVQRRCRSPYALPAFLLAVPILFHLVIQVCGLSLEQVRQGGWMAHTNPEDGQWRFWHLYDLYKGSGGGGRAFPYNILWSALPGQMGKLLGLYFVVAFGSSMDIAAIKTDFVIPEADEEGEEDGHKEADDEQAQAHRSKRDKKPTSDDDGVNYNKELITVGISNLVNGCVGVGLTGSYIFSQTLFSMKTGVQHRVMGVVVVVLEALVFAAPINTMAFLPNFYFGALVLWIGIDISKDWLYISRKKVAPLEYAMLVGTFLAVASLGLEVGIALGVLAAALHFAVEYARLSVTAFSVVPSRSGAVRSFRQRMVLEAFDGRVAAVALSGMIFFGSATTMAEKVSTIAAALLENQPSLVSAFKKKEKPGVSSSSSAVLSGSVSEGGSSRGSDLGTTAPSLSSSPHSHGSAVPPPPARRAVIGQLSRKMHALRSVPSARTLCQTYDGIEALYDTNTPPVSEQLQQQLQQGHQSLPQHPGSDVMLAAGEALQEAPLVLLLDFSRVHGVDATAARSFLTLHARLKRRGVTMALTGLRSDDGVSARIRKILLGQGLILSEVGQPNTNTNEGGLSEYGNCNHSTDAVPWFLTMDQGLHWCEEAFLRVAERHGLCEPPPSCVTLAEVLRTNLEVPRAFLGLGSIDHEGVGAVLQSFCTRQLMHSNEVLFDRGNPSDCMYIVEKGIVSCWMDYARSSIRGRAAAAALPLDMALHPNRSARLLEYGPGGIVGDLDFALQRPRSFVAMCRGEGSVWRLTRGEFERLAREKPQVLVLLQTVVLRLNCLSASHAFEALERARI